MCQKCVTVTFLTSVMGNDPADVLAGRMVLGLDLLKRSMVEEYFWMVRN